MNVSDSEKIAGWYESQGWKLARKIEEADEIVVNTCSVRESAENRVFGLVNNLRRKGTNLPAGRQGVQRYKGRIVLTGCMMRYPLRWLKEKLPQVDEFKKILEFAQSSRFIIHGSNVHAWVPIMEGCNNFCSYCVVPYARGREVSRPFEEIICEVKELVKRSYKEITLLGQNVNSYGKDIKILRYENIGKDAKVHKTEFANLLSKLNNINGLEKISFMTSNPWDLTDDIIKAIKLPKVDKYLHLPVQSGDNEILKKMNRKYTAQEFTTLVKRIRKEIPEIKIGTDIIVGFPGETLRQFQNTTNLCKKIGFVKAYISIYSPRPGTAAFKLKEKIPFKEKRRRWLILENLINQN